MMADDVNALGDWIEQNVDTPGMKGSPEWVQKTEQYRQLRQAQLSEPPPDANSWGNTAKRVATNFVTGLPDTAIAIGNAGVRASKSMPFNLGMAGVANPADVKEAPYLGPKMLSAMGGEPLPQDASTTRQLLEAGASALPGGVTGAVRAAAGAAPGALQAILPAVRSLLSTTVAPTIASHYLGEGGGYAADKLGLDKETGSLLGSLLGGVGSSGVSPAAKRLTHEYYASRGREGAPAIAAAAARQEVPTTAGMLGNQDIQQAERNLANSRGASGYINDRRQSARDQMGVALDRAAAARGSTDAAPTPGTIGYDVANVARVRADQLGNESSAGQQELMNRVGPRTQTDISGVLAAMENIRNRTDPGTAAPIDARLNTMRQMLPLDPEGNVISTNVPYERVKDWRTGLRERSQGYDAVPGRFATEIYDATTGAMRDAGESQGVPGGYFDTVQGRTARIMGEGGPHEQLSGVGAGEPTKAFGYLKAGEQNPERLRTLQNTGSPDMDRVFGDYLRLIGNQTLGQNGARGPINFADRIDRMHPEALDVIAGPQRQPVTDISTLARSFDYPTSQTGLGRTVGPIASGAARVVSGSTIGHALGQATGIPGAATAGAAAGAYAQIPIARTKAWLLQHDLTRNALGGGAPPQGLTTSDLVAAINAAQAAQQQQRGAPGVVPR
jgi:hypothetical protein